MVRPEIPYKDKPGIIPDEPMDSAGRKIFIYYLSRMLKYETAVRESDDPEGVHSMRVSIRRLRSALSTFEDYYRLRIIKDYRKEFRGVATALGEARDLDVAIHAGEFYAATLDMEHRAAFQGLLDAWSAQLAASRVTLRTTLNGTAYADLVDRFAVFASTPERYGKSPDTDEPEPYLVRHVVPMLVVERNAAVRAYERVFEGEDLDTLHRLRIEAKKLRYALESFAEVLGSQSNQVVNMVKKLQDDLGAIQDTRTASSRIVEYAATATPASASAALEYLRVRKSERRHLLRAARATWRRFNQKSTQRALYKALDSLL
ncbi:MAG TPA: CHAD domain-containing protein [Aggregatilineales bacterium]|nr:CHAD domain-containing protein [Aggregatilineales bacterium]